MIPVADFFGMCGMSCFLMATLKQWYKIRTTHHTTAISKTNYKLRIVAGFCSLICFALAGLHLSFAVVTIELCFAFSTLSMLAKYRKKKTVSKEEFLGMVTAW